MELKRLPIKVVLLMSIFMYLYSINLKVMPTSFNMLLGALGIGIATLKWMTSKGQHAIMVSHSLGSILLSMLAVVCISVLSLICNSTSDVYFIKLMVTNSISFAGAYALSLFVKHVYNGKIEFHVLVKYITMAACIQMILTLWLFFTPNPTEILSHVLAYNELESSVMNQLEGFRLMGFGTTFFGSGIIHGFTLIIIAITMHIKKYSFLGTFGYTFSFILIGAVGMMMARTTLVGIALALILAIYWAKFWKLLISKKIRDIFKTLFVITAIMTVIILNLPPDMLDVLTMTSNFGFEMFIKLFSSGKLETNSTNIMFTMYVFPDNWKTWLVGDGFFADPLDPKFSYYMGTDIGFIRLLFYFGFLGLIAFLIYQMVIVYQVYIRNKKIGIIPFIVIYGLFLALNLKGLADLFILLVLFYFVNTNKREVNQ